MSILAFLELGTELNLAPIGIDTTLVPLLVVELLLLTLLRIRRRVTVAAR
jgi:hypothetical protein